MFTVRQIKDNWYFEVPDTLLGRLLLAVTRFKAVPQGFKMLSGEEVNRSVVYWEQHDDKTLFLREYVQSQFARPGDNIAEALKQSTVDPVIYKFDVIGSLLVVRKFGQRVLEKSHPVIGKPWLHRFFG